MASEPFPKEEEKRETQIGRLVASLDLCTKPFNRKLKKSIKLVRKLRRELEEIHNLVEDL